MDEIGQKLREARIEKGYTIDDLQQITKIQKRYLIAIEEGNFSALPGDFYVRAFIKQYASVVGINVEQLMEDYQQDIPSVTPTQVDEPENDDVQPTRSASHPERAVAAKRSVRRYLPQIVIGAAVLLIIIVVYGLTISQQRKDAKPSIPVDQSSVSVQGEKKSKKKASSSSKASASSKKTPKKAKKSTGLKIGAATGTDVAPVYAVKNLKDGNNTLKLNASTADAWMSVSVDGAVSWQGVVSAGGDHSLTIPTTAKTVAVRTGNATVTTIHIGSKKVKVAKATTMVRTLTFNINGAQGAATTTGNTQSSSTQQSSQNTQTNSNNAGTTTGTTGSGTSDNNAQ
ncbi:DUF4115 domain-containing protein [Lacticaseibacillus pabuli]|uniref:DUF4115 domain-containing protein n=1 Tax=Lacticaseibacillus pabuli TaxID=3025672 RepID=A0ABY7WPA8_9LACO|nr:RodZ domain-containing protein [Lacticaseibacillus sp. KACC 23028]WDF82004.1 DUF4115 domain-containing protein [Lacticaseibacillus sp. KACC 23028]